MPGRDVMLQRAAAMRRQPTEPEKILWRHLSRCQLRGYKFRRQAILGDRIVDFLCPAKALIVEVDGDTHDYAADIISDRTMLRHHGYNTIRVTNADVRTNIDGVLAQILNMLDQLPDRWHKPKP